MTQHPTYFILKIKFPLIDSRFQRPKRLFVFFEELIHSYVLLQSAIFISTNSCSISAFHCFHATNQITSRFGFRQGLRQRSVSREALGPRMAFNQKQLGLRPLESGMQFQLPTYKTNRSRNNFIVKSAAKWNNTIKKNLGNV